MNTVTDVSGDIWQISDHAKKTFITINLVALCTCVSCFGICTNAINIKVFVIQGFKETINLTLFAITISDLSSLIALLWESICHNPLLLKSGAPLLPEEVQYLTGGMPHVVFCMITGWLTAFLTVERCVCVLYPLKVKAIFTPTRNKIIIAVIYTLVIASVSPIYFGVKLDWKYVPDVNRTMLGLVYREDADTLLSIGHTLIGLPCSLPFSVIVVMSTLMLVISLKRQTKWRQQTAANDKSGVTKEKAVIKMVIAIAMILIVCLLIPSLVNIPVALFPEFNVSGKYGNLLFVVVSFLKVIEGVNSSVNIFVYYKMSNNYRRTFQEIFLKHKLNDDCN